MNTSELKSLMQSALSHLYSRDEIAAITRMYLEHKLPNSGSQHFFYENPVLPDFTGQIESDVARLADGCPVQYIVGTQWFYNRPFKVSQAVLIPRPETEELVSMIVTEIKKKSPRILDIGTGSGCIAITLKLEIPGSQVFATDISKPALEIAAGNALKHSAEVNFILDDVLASTISHDDNYDLIISNPPYIPLSESVLMDKNVVDFEPAIALYAPDSDPYQFYKAIVHLANVHLNPEGMLYLEIHKNGGKEVRNILINQRFTEVEIRKDISGNERFIKAYKAEQ